MRDYNERFIMVPISLLEIPEFVRYFDSKAIGSIYRVLSSKVWRVPKEGLRKNASKRIHILSGLYESGALVSMHDLSSLAEAVGYTERSVRRELELLETLGLVRIQKIEKEIFYIVGETNPASMYDGGGMGMSAEVFYLNRWRDFVNYANQYAPEKLNLFKEDLVSILKDGQICHEFLTEISQISNLEGYRNLVSETKTEKLDAPLIDKVIDNTTKTVGLDVPDKKVVIREISSASPTDAITLSRKAIISEVLTLTEAHFALSAHVPGEYRHFNHAPMFAIRLADYKNVSEKAPEHTKLANLWIALREDLTGAVMPSSGTNEFKKIVGMVKNMLKKYSFNQLYWTLTTVAQGGLSEAQFCVKSIGAWEYLVKKYSHKYQAMRESLLREEESRAKIAEARKNELNYEIPDDPNAGDENTGRLLDAIMGWSSENNE